jgi:SAM-dependent methyltransferase
MGRRLDLLRKLPYVRPYDSRRWGVYDSRTQQVVTNRLSTIDPEVWGRYDLASQKVVPKDAEDPGVWRVDFDRAAPAAQALLRDRPELLEQERYELVLAHLGPGSGTLLDACTTDPAPGVRSRVQRLGFDYVPIDIRPRRGIRQEDVTALSFADGSIARIVSLDTLEHVEGYERALAEFLRVLEPGGVCVVHVPCYYFDKPDSEPISEGVDPWGHVRYFSAHELARTMRDLGFVLLRVGLHLDYGAAVCVGGKAL